MIIDITKYVTPFGTYYSLADRDLEALPITAKGVANKMASFRHTKKWGWTHSCYTLFKDEVFRVVEHLAYKDNVKLRVVGEVKCPRWGEPQWLTTNGFEEVVV